MTTKDLDKLKAQGNIRGYSSTGKAAPKANKFGAQKVVFDDIVFDSRKEGRKYLELRARRKAGEISELQVKEEFVLFVNGNPVCTYISDFTFIENGQKIVMDVKSTATRKLRVYRMKKKLMLEVYGITITEA